MLVRFVLTMDLDGGNSIEGFTECIGKAMESNLIEFGRRAYEYYCNNFDVHYVYQNIIEKNKRKSS